MKSTVAVSALASLAHEVRLAIFRLLVRAGPGGLRAGDIADTLRIAGPNLTFHLSHMRQAGLVSSRRAGRNVIYAADYGQMTALIGYLQQNCCEGVANSTAEPAAEPTRETALKKEPVS